MRAAVERHAKNLTEAPHSPFGAVDSILNLNSHWEIHCEFGFFRNLLGGVETENQGKRPTTVYSDPTF
jgi:hypothetical protein